MSINGGAMSAISWRVRVFDGEYEFVGQDLPLIAEMQGKAQMSGGLASGPAAAGRYLHCVLAQLDARQVQREPIDRAARIRPAITVLFDRGRADECAVARFDVPVDHGRVHASILDGGPRWDAEPFLANGGDSVWDVKITRVVAPSG